MHKNQIDLTTSKAEKVINSCTNVFQLNNALKYQVLAEYYLLNLVEKKSIFTFKPCLRLVQLAKKHLKEVYNQKSKQLN